MLCMFCLESIVRSILKSEPADTEKDAQDSTTNQPLVKWVYKESIQSITIFVTSDYYTSKYVPEPQQFNAEPQWPNE